MWAIRSTKLVIVAATVGPWVFSFLIFENACSENCELSVTAQFLRWATLGAASIAVYAAYRVAVTEHRLERRHGLIFTVAALVVWALLLGALLLGV